MHRIAISVVGAQGQGVNSVGGVLGKGLKRAGYCVFGYREYMSLIKGGHSSYQLDVSDEKIESSATTVDILVTFNHHGLEKNVLQVREGGVIIHQTPQWKFPPDVDALLKQRKITVLYLPTEDILKKIKGSPILGNILVTSVVWALLGQSQEELKGLVREQFSYKGEAVVAINHLCIDEGFAFTQAHAKNLHVALPPADNVWSKQLYISGSEAMGLGAIHAGVRLYAGYPMTPSSPLLSFIADLQNKTGMVIKQAEDEITAAQMVSGAMYMGTRALTATSGGGFDLMSETLSMNGILENPTVFVLAQRPGPATGLPTWTAQGDLLLAVHTAHGEFARCVISVSDAEDSFRLMPIAFNLAEEYQISVIVLTDKQIAEALYTVPAFDQSKTEIKRGKLVTDAKALTKLKATDRFDAAAKDGISSRWLPGHEAATYNAQADEHTGDGSIDESAEGAKAQMEKRMKKMEVLKQALPEPELWKMVNGKWKMENNSSDIDVLLVGWGSTKSTVLDVLKRPEFSKKKIGYLHYTYLWPLKTEVFASLQAKASKTILIEQNYQGQLGKLLTMESGITITDRILKYDGRPFFEDELFSEIEKFL
jgi:2-oxoglutarate ferredoxin oxidoreductase subunit alpha